MDEHYTITSCAYDKNIVTQHFEEGLPCLNLSNLVLWSDVFLIVEVRVNLDISKIEEGLQKEDCSSVWAWLGVYTDLKRTWTQSFHYMENCLPEKRTFRTADKMPRCGNLSKFTPKAGCTMLKVVLKNPKISIIETKSGSCCCWLKVNVCTNRRQLHKPNLQRTCASRRSLISKVEREKN